MLKPLMTLKHFKQGKRYFKINLHFIITGKTAQGRLGIEPLHITLHIYSLVSENSRQNRQNSFLGH